MPWTCPTSRTWIHHDGDSRRPQTIYRCHVCRLELILDQNTHKLIVAPLPFERDEESDAIV